MGVLRALAARIPSRLVLIGTALLLATLHPLVAPAQQRAPRSSIVVFVGAKSTLTSISLSTLRRVFTGMPTEFENGARFIPFNHPTGTPARVQFDRQVLGLEPEQVGPFWIARRIRDESPAPRTVPTAEMAVRVVAGLPSAISYAYGPVATAGIKLLKIDEKAAGQPGYPLD